MEKVERGRDDKVEVRNEGEKGVRLKRREEEGNTGGDGRHCNV